MNKTAELSPFFINISALSETAVNDLSDHFNHLPKNDYLDGEYRLRRYSVFTYNNGQVNKLPYEPFTQSDKFNTFQGNVERHYEDITIECYQSKGFLEMMASYAERAGLPGNNRINVHQL